jgi:ADP-ribosyl-[dinitrogen reductase] hydrolase
MQIPIEDKIRGCLWGIVVGDALGAPVEGYSAEKIADIHTRVTEYKQPLGHKWFNDQPLGFWTDDTHLSFAVVKALLEANDFDMDAIAKYHTLAMAESVEGWGYSTQESIRKLKDGAHWSESGITDNPNRGTGNGVPMKIAPIAIWDFMVGIPNTSDPSYKKIVQFSAMSHYTDMSAYAAIAHTQAIQHCLAFQPEEFDENAFIDEIVDHAYVEGFVEHAKLDPPLTKKEDSLRERFNLLFGFESDKKDRLFESASGCYVYHSLPFTYAHFLKDQTIEGLYNVVNAGGDTDTNGSMFASMIGALHGKSIFPTELIDGVQKKEELHELVERFVEQFV